MTDIPEKFASVPHEDDTEIFSSEVIAFGDFEVLYESWAFEGVHGESISFTEDDAEGLRDEELQDLVEESPLYHGGNHPTVRREDGFVVVSFNFSAD